MTAQDTAAAALEYARRGWHVFPARIKDGGKRSFIAGLKNGGARWGSTTDPDTIRDYWNRWPEALLGITTGPDSGFFVIDVDSAAGHSADGINNFAELVDQHGALPHTIEADTPSGGRHIYFKWPAALEIKNSASALAPGIDVRGEGGMVLAAPTIKPGTEKAYRWANPPGLFEVADCPDWLLDAIRATQAPLSERASPTGFQIDTGGATTWADAALREELARLLAAPKGQRNGVLNSAAFNLGQIVAGGGLTEETIKARLSAAAAGIGLEPGETAATIESGLRAGAQTPRGPKERATTGIPAPAPDHQPKPAPLRSSVFFCAADLEGQPIPARQWLVDGLIPRGTVSLLGGDGGTGKSLVALQLAVATATGGAWLGLPVTAGRAIYISAEDDHDELHRRLADIVRAEGVTLADLDNLTVRSLAGEDALLAALDRAGGGLLASALFHEVDRRIGDESPALMVLDTLADLFPGNENDRAQARQFIGLLRGLAIRHECAVVMLAHPSLSGLNSGSGTSGSTGWNNSVRSRLYLSRVIQDGYEANPDVRMLSIMKSNYGRLGGEIAMRWQAGVFVTEAQPTGLDRMAIGAKAERVFFALLREFTDQGRRVNSNGGPNYAPKLFAEHPDSEGMTKRALKSAMETLLAQKKVSIGKEGSPSRRVTFLQSGQGEQEGTEE